MPPCARASRADHSWRRDPHTAGSDRRTPFAPCPASRCQIAHFVHIDECVLNHTSDATGGLVGVYQRYEYLDERKQALNAWGECVDQIVQE